MRSEFEKAFRVPAHWIEFDEKSNKYYCPYVADAKAGEYQSMWSVWQHQQSKVDELTQLHAKELFNKEVVANRAAKWIVDLQEENDELQKRVDAALERAGHACIGTAMFHKQFSDVIAILRGEQALKGDAE